MINRLHRSICLPAQRFSALGMTIALLSGSALVPRVAAAEQPATPVQPNAATTAAPAADTAATPGSDSPATVPEAAPAPATISRPGTPSQSAALDFCALKSHAPAGRYHIQRVLFANPLIAPGMDAPETETDAKGNVVGQYSTLASIKAGERTRVLVSNQLPLQRLFTVYSPAVATPELFGKTELKASDLAEVTGGDSFASYSAGCADWVVLPKITRNGGSWQKVKRKKTVIVNNQSREVEYLAWDFSVGFLIELAVFKRTGDASFALYRVLSSAGAEGMFAGGAAGEPHSVPFHDYVSTWPNASCSIGEPHDGQAGGIAQCTTVEPKLSAELDTEFVTTGGGCGSDDAVGTPMDKIAACGVASATANAVHVLQLHVKQGPWDMFAELGEGVSMALGKREGVRRGDYYAATPPGQHDSTGFARVMSVGLGGSEGDANPSHLKFKTGDAPVGSRLTEVPLLGVQIAVRPLFLFLVDKGDLDTTIGYGGAASLAYDLSSTIPLFDELHLQADFGYLVGSSKESFIPIDLGAHGSFYLSSGLTAELGLGLDVLIANKQTTASGGQEVTWSGTSTGAFARAGLEHAFSPHWDVAFAVQARAGTSAKLKSDQVPNVTGDAGSLLGGLAMASLGYTL